MRGRRFSTVQPAPDFHGIGNVEIESTPTHTVLRLHAPETGDVAEVDLDAEAAIKAAAQLMFCALRHVSDPDEAVKSFMARLDEAGREMQRQKRAGRPS